MIKIFVTIGKHVKFHYKEVKMAFIEKFTFELTPIPCEVGSEDYKLTAKIGKSLNDFLPYLNGYIKKGLYTPGVNTFVFNFEGHKVSLTDDKIMIARIKSKDEGKELAEKLITFLNEIYEKKDEIFPCYDRREPPKALDIYKALPKTNCKKCGEPSCFVFATKLSQGDHEIEDCTELSDEDFKKIEEMF